MSTVTYRDFLTGDAGAAADEALRTALANLNLSVEAQLKAVVQYTNAIDKAHPTIECSTTPQDGFVINGSQLVQFMVGLRQVRAYWLMIQNNSSSSLDIYFRLNSPAGGNAFVLSPGQTYEGWVAACHAVGFYTTGAIGLNTQSGVSIQAMTTQLEAGMG